MPCGFEMEEISESRRYGRSDGKIACASAICHHTARVRT